MIHFENVTKYYSNGHAGLSGVSFTIPKGEMTFLTGHSGAGKSTVLKMLCLMDRPTQGNVIVNGRNLGRLPKRHIPRARREIGIIFQSPRLMDDYSVFDNVALPLVVAGFHKTEIGRRVRAALDKVGLLQKERMFPADISTGEQQRVGIARAIVNKPSILLADEPTGNLDPKLACEIMGLFEAFNQVGVTMLIATHDLALIGRMKHRILTLHQGRMVSTGVRMNVDEV